MHVQVQHAWGFIMKQMWCFVGYCYFLLAVTTTLGKLGIFFLMLSFAFSGGVDASATAVSIIYAFFVL